MPEKSKEVPQAPCNNGQPDDQSNILAIVAREAAIREFQAFAVRFDSIAADFRAPKATGFSRPYAISLLQLMNDTGTLLVNCARKGWLSMIPGLEELILWLDGKDLKDSPPRLANLVRSPTNVFIEVVGDNQVRVKNEGGSCILISDPEGGLLPAAFPQLFPPVPYLRAADSSSGDEAKEFHRLREIAYYERCAKTCRILADFLNSEPVEKEVSGGSKALLVINESRCVPMTLADIVRRYMDDQDARTEKIKPILIKHGLRREDPHANKWTLCLDTLDTKTRERMTRKVYP